VGNHSHQTRKTNIGTVTQRKGAFSHDAHNRTLPNHAALAPISYWWLTQYAAHKELGNPFIQMFVRAFASLAHFIAGAFVLIAVAIVFMQWHRSRSHQGRPKDFRATQSLEEDQG
jgi:hypothetical protein